MAVFHLDEEEPVGQDACLWVSEQRISAVLPLLRVNDLLHDEGSRDGAQHVVTIEVNSVHLVQTRQPDDVLFVVLQLLR